MLTEVLDQSPAVRHVIVVGDVAPSDGEGDRHTLTWVELVDAAPEFEPRRSIDLDMAAILYTSGSTEYPRVSSSATATSSSAPRVSATTSEYRGRLILAALPLSFDAGSAS